MVLESLFYTHEAHAAVRSQRTLQKVRDEEAAFGLDDILDKHQATLGERTLSQPQRPRGARDILGPSLQLFRWRVSLSRLSRSR